MNKYPVKVKLNRVLQGFNRYGESICDFTKLDDDLGIDSLGVFMLIAELEATFDITIDAEKERTRDNFGTVAQLQSFIIQKLDEELVKTRENT